MFSYDEVEKYKNQVVRKKYIKDNLPMLEKRKDELKEIVEKLEKKKKSEDKDVKRLEGHTLAAFIYSATGKIDEKIDQEKAEAYEATVKYELAASELEEVTKEIKVMEYDLSCYGNAEINYDKAIDKWAENFSSSLTDEEVLYIRSSKIELDIVKDKRKRIKDIQNTISKAITTTRKIVTNLNEAKSWGIQDIFINIGYYADYAKLDKLRTVENDLRELNKDICKIKDELKGNCNINQLVLNLSTDWDVADMVFDSGITEIGHLSEIKKAKKSVEEFTQQLEMAYDNLKKNEEELFEKEIYFADEIASVLENMKV